MFLTFGKFFFTLRFLNRKSYLTKSYIHWLKPNQHISVRVAVTNQLSGWGNAHRAINGTALLKK